MFPNWLWCHKPCVCTTFRSALRQTWILWMIRSNPNCLHALRPWRWTWSPRICETQRLGSKNNIIGYVSVLLADHFFENIAVTARTNVWSELCCIFVLNFIRFYRSHAFLFLGWEESFLCEESAIALWHVLLAATVKISVYLRNGHLIAWFDGYRR